MNILVNNVTFTSAYSQTSPVQKRQAVYFHGLKNSPQKDTVKFSSSPKEKEWSLWKEEAIIYYKDGKVVVLSEKDLYDNGITTVSSEFFSKVY